MEKKTIISAVILVLLLGLIIFNIKDNKIVSIITLDINPSVEINLDKNDKVVSVVALNKDAKNVISDVKGKSLDKALDNIVKNLIKKEYIDNDFVEIILYSDGNVSNDKIKTKLSKSLNDKNIGTNIIVIKNVTKEDKELAKKYDVSPAKVAYIKTITKDKKISIEKLIDKSISEIVETKNTGKYCDEGYVLEGDWCLKEVEQTKASTGEICPSGYIEYDGTCYEETHSEDTGELYCNEGLTLKGKKCVETRIVDAIPKYSCSTGELVKKGDLWKIGIEDHDKMVCVDKSSGEAPTLRCLTINHTMVDGKCADGPKPTINGGCEPGDYLIGGGCYTLDNGDQYVCPNGNIYHKSQDSVPEVCPDTLSYTEPTITGYKCDNNYTLDGDKCVSKRTEDPIHKRECPNGSIQINDNQCIDLNKVKDKENGFVCEEEDTRIKGNKCIHYERTEAKHA